MARSLGDSLRLGAGLAGLGYGLYRYSRGQRDPLTTLAVTTGLTVTLNELTGTRNTGPLVAAAVSAFATGQL